MRRPAARAALLCAAWAAASLPGAGGATTGGRNCDGRFECEGFDFDPALSRSPHGGSQGLRCTYGHIEKSVCRFGSCTPGDCSTPCTGVRRGWCRCKTKAEAEDSVVEAAQQNLYIAVGVTVIGLLFGAWSIKMMMRSRSQQYEQEPSGPIYEESSSPPDNSNPENGEATVVQGSVVPVTVVGTPLSAQPDGGNQPQAVQPTVVEGNVISSSSSRLDNMAKANPHKARMMTGIFTVVIPLFMVGYWVYQVSVSDEGIFESFSLFMGLAGIVSYVVVFSIVVARAITIMGMSNFIEAQGSAPFQLFAKAYAKVFLGLPVVGLAGVAWALSRMSSPEGIYSTC